MTAMERGQGTKASPDASFSSGVRRGHVPASVTGAESCAARQTVAAAMTSARFEQELPRNHDAPWLARRWLGEWFGAVLEADALHRAKLLTSELVTNAFLHGRGRITLSAEVVDDRLLVEVADEGSGFDREASRRSADHLRGRGLAIVEAEAATWGIRDGQTQVWFELPVSTPMRAAGQAPGGF